MNEHPNLSDELAFKRTIWALERTQLAWIRTSFAITSAGLAVAKGSSALLQAKLLEGPWLSSLGHILGISIALFSGIQMLLASWEFSRRQAELERSFPVMTRSMNSVIPLSLLVALYGFLVAWFLVFFR